MVKKKREIKIKETEYTRSRAEKIADALDLPKELVLNLPKLIFTGNRELFVENYQGIVEYSDTVIRLNTSECLLKITGRGLGIKNIATEEITLCGDIKTLEFC